MVLCVGNCSSCLLLCNQPVPNSGLKKSQLFLYFAHESGDDWAQWGSPCSWSYAATVRQQLGLESVSKPSSLICLVFELEKFKQLVAKTVGTSLASLFLCLYMVSKGH